MWISKIIRKMLQRTETIILKLKNVHLIWSVSKENIAKDGYQ